MKRTSTPMRPHGARAFALMAVLASACATPQGGEDGAERSLTADDLAMSLEAQVGDTAVHFRLHATNTSDAPVVLEFASGQRFDFIVRDAGGSEVWRWSEDRMFTQALGQESIPPGETVTFDGTWPTQGRTGTYEAVGRITTRPPLEQEATFVLAGAGGR